MAVSENLAATYLDPEDYVSETAVLRFAIRQLIAKIETMVPVTVIAVHPGSGTPPAVGTVDVQPLLTMLDGSGNAIQPGVIYGLPYFRLQGGPWAVICDPAVNDVGFIIAAARDISNLTKNQPAPGIQNPGSWRQYRYSDGVYVGGIYNAVPKATLWLKTDGTFVLTTQDGLVLNSDGSGNLAVKGNIAVTGNITATGEITRGLGGADQVTLGQHIHPANGSPPTPGH